MAEIGIRDLKQNASEIIARAEAGDALTVTRRGRPVARIVPLGTSRLDELRNAGLLIEPLRSPTELAPPRRLEEDEPTPSELLDELRGDERY